MDKRDVSPPRTTRVADYGSLLKIDGNDYRLALKESLPARAWRSTWREAFVPARGGDQPARSAGSTATDTMGAYRDTEDLINEGSQSILVSGEKTRLGLGPSNRVAGMGRSNHYGVCQPRSHGGSRATSRRRISVFCVGDGVVDVADLFCEG